MYFSSFIQAKKIQEAPQAETTGDSKNVSSEFDEQGFVKKIELVLNDYKVILKNLKDYLYNQGRGFYNMGQEDGLKGHPPHSEIHDKAQTEALNFKNMASAELTAVVETLKLQEDSLRDVYNDTIEEKEFLYDQHQALLINEQHLPTLFSSGTSYMYLAIAFVLLIGDIYLSNTLVYQVFQFRLESEQLSAIMTSVGIAFLSAFIKVYYDEHIAISDGSAIMRLNKLNTLPHASSKIWFYIEVTMKFMAKTVILLCIVYLLYKFAAARFEADKAIRLAKAGRVSAMTIELQEITRDVYIGMTTLIPIVSGIFFSIAFRIRQNIALIEKSKNKCADIQTRASKELAELHEAQKYSRIAEKVCRDWIGKEDFVTNSKLYLLSFYSRGHMHGLTASSNKGIIEQMNDFRNRVATKKRVSLTHQPIAP